MSEICEFSHGGVESLEQICIKKLLVVLEETEFHPKLINDLCKGLPEHILEQILQCLLRRKAITDITLLQFLVPSRSYLHMAGSHKIMNSTLKQIGINCPHLKSLDLTDCAQVSNAVVQDILKNCPKLENLVLDKCKRITDAAFDKCASIFEPLLALLSIQSISLQACPQIQGNFIYVFNKNCRALTSLSLSQCKLLSAMLVADIFEHQNLSYLNLSFNESLTDEIFTSITPVVVPPKSSREQFVHRKRCPISYSITSLNISKCSITDLSMAHIAALRNLTELRMQWCAGISDATVMMVVEHCTCLQTLDLQSCQLTDMSLVALGKHAQALRYLDISWCSAVTDEGLLQLSQREDSGDSWSGCVSLERLNILWLPQLTDACVAAFLSMVSLRTLCTAGSGCISPTSLAPLQNRGVDVRS